MTSVAAHVVCVKSRKDDKKTPMLAMGWRSMVVCEWIRGRIQMRRGDRISNASISVYC